jgi:hypothetical protein
VFPNLGVGHSGTARLCTEHHAYIYVGGQSYPPDPLHIDVSTKLWNRTHVP